MGQTPLCFKNHPKFKIIPTLFLLVGLALNGHGSSGENCDRVFISEDSRKVVVGKSQKVLTVQSLINRVRNQNHRPLPQFRDWKREIENPQFWEGSLGPLIFREALPEGIKLINHELLQSNGPGFVKIAEGLSAHARAPFGLGSNQGGETNIIFPAKALLDNLGRTKKSLVQDEAEVAIVFLHGGATVTTGSHSAAPFIDYFSKRKVAVIALDKPWHGEGVRHFYRNPREYFEELRNFIRRFIKPSGKPIVLMGHSLGGLEVDLYRTFYSKNDDLVSALISLSTIPDPAPGRLIIEEKWAKADEIDSKNSNDLELAEFERSFDLVLNRDDKINPFGWTFADFLWSAIDWARNKENQDQLLPALYIMGAYDFLYRGHEKDFDDYIASLKNTEFVLMHEGLLIFNNEKTKVGHLILDHAPLVQISDQISTEDRRRILNGKLSPQELKQFVEKGLVQFDQNAFRPEDLGSIEVFVRITQYLEKITGKELKRQDKRPPSSVAGFAPELGEVLHAYLNDLRFRHFAKMFSLQYFKPTEKTQQAGRELETISNTVAQLRKRFKEKMDPQEKEQIQKKIQELEVRQKELKNIVSGMAGVPKERLSEFNLINEQIREHFKDTNDLSTERLGLHKEMDMKRALLRRKSNLLIELAQYLEFPKLERAQKLTNQLLERKVYLDSQKIRQRMRSYILSVIRNENNKSEGLFENVPDDIVKLLEEYKDTSAKYLRAKRIVDNRMIGEILNGRFQLTANGVEMLKQYAEEWQLSAEDLGQPSRWFVSLAREIIALQEEIKRIQSTLIKMEYQFAFHANAMTQLNRRKAQMMGSEYFELHEYKLEDLLNMNTEQIKQMPEFTTIIHRFWEAWRKTLSQSANQTSKEGLY
ncbi:MAG: alpha/beta fold hydrolase [Bdellovibrionaceae bacterium]|nr:alpha/beta fold hydrolase [Pseudobdellovibrionaceae bacterium]